MTKATICSSSRVWAEVISAKTSLLCSRWVLSDPFPCSPSLLILDWLPFGYSRSQPAGVNAASKDEMHTKKGVRADKKKKVRNNQRVRWGHRADPWGTLLPFHQHPLMHVIRQFWIHNLPPHLSSLHTPLWGFARVPDWAARIQIFHAHPTQPHLGLIGEKCNVDFRQSLDDFGCSWFHQLIKQGIWTSCKNMTKDSRLSCPLAASFQQLHTSGGVFILLGFQEGNWNVRPILRYPLTIRYKGNVKPPKRPSTYNRETNGNKIEIWELINYFLISGKGKKKPIRD